MSIELWKAVRCHTGRCAHRAALRMAAFLCSICALQAWGAYAGPSPVSEQVLDEAVVSGTRLWNLREDVIKADNAFYALFNELNTDDDFDVHCRTERLKGLHITRRMCRPGYLEEALEDDARDFIAEMNGRPGSISAPPAHVLVRRQDEWRDNMLKVINSDARLRQLFRERERLQRRYEAERLRHDQQSARRP